MQVKKQQLELDMEQETGSKLGKESVKAVYCHPAYLHYSVSNNEIDIHRFSKMLGTIFQKFFMISELIQRTEEIHVIS